MDDDDTDFMCLFESEDKLGQDYNEFLIVVHSEGAQAARYSELDQLPAELDLDSEGVFVTPRGFALKGKVWTNAEVKRPKLAGRLQIGVGFLDGSNSLQSATLVLANEWCVPSGAAVDFVPSSIEQADIRVTFNTSENKSALGSDANFFGRSSPTMWLGDARLVGGRPTNRMKRVVRHEFGHALGLSHEHQHPEAEFDWNFDAVVRDFLGKSWAGCNVDRPTCEAGVKRNITEKIGKSDVHVVSSNIDRASIMMYPVKRSWLNSGSGTSNNVEISLTDLAVVNEMYG